MSIDIKSKPFEVTARLAPSLPGTKMKPLVIQGRVDDKALAKKLPDGFDGLERPFALIPTLREGGVEWKRQDLGFMETPNNGNGRVVSSTDFYQAEGLVTEQDANLIKEKGVAFGVDTNRGTFWLQEAGDNLIPDDR